MRAPRVFEVVSCFDCGLVVNRVDEIHDQTQGGKPFVDHACVDCGESCGPWIKVVEVIDGE